MPRVASLTELDELLELVFRQTERHRERVAADTYLHRLRQRRGLWILGGLHLRQVDQKFDHVAQRVGILRRIGLRLAAEDYTGAELHTAAGRLNGLKYRWNLSVMSGVLGGWRERGG